MTRGIGGQCFKCRRGVRSPSALLCWRCKQRAKEASLTLHPREKQIRRATVDELLFLADRASRGLPVSGKEVKELIHDKIPNAASCQPRKTSEFDCKARPAYDKKHYKTPRRVAM